MRKGLLAILLCLMMLTASASAGIPALDALESHLEAGQVYGLSVGVQLKAWPDLTDRTLQAVQDWLSNRKLQLSLEHRDEVRSSQARLTYDGQEMLGLFMQTGADNADFIVSDTSNAPLTRYTGTLAQPPWQVLLGVDAALPDWGKAQAALQAIAEAALPHLLEAEKPVKTSTSIKNAGRGASQLVYTYKMADAQALWQAMAGDVLPHLDNLFGALLMEHAQAATTSLRTLEMKGALTIKRILDKDDRDLGLQITGTMALDGVNRKLTLFGGQSDTGAYLSLKLPATRGNDTLELQLSLPEKEGELAADWRLKWVSGKDSLNTTGVIALKSKPADLGETLNGSITLKVRRRGSVSDDTEYALKPVLTFSGLNLDGSLTLQITEGTRLSKDLLFTLTGTPEEALVAPTAQAVTNVSALTPAQLALESARVQGVLVPQLTAWLSELPYEDLRLILHDLGRERRADSDAPLPPPLNDFPAFTVTDATNPPPTKEDTP